MEIIKRNNIFFIIIIFIFFAGCKSDSDYQSGTSGMEGEDMEMTEVSEDTFIESEEDLLSVDYQIFYNELEPYGEWIEISTDEITDEPASSSILKNIFGVNEAYAQDITAAFVWRPTTGVDVVTTLDPVSGVDAAVAWQPFSRGEWILTDNGWYFMADSRPMEITHHYGRWWNSPDLGWVWVPGKVWSPAWVDWRESDDLIAWTPLPPNAFIVNNAIPVVVDVPLDNWVVVERREFTRPEIYKYMVIENKNKTIIHEMRKLDGPMVVNHTIINKGPDVRVLETIVNVPVQKRTIERVSNIKEVRDRDKNVVVTFTPALREVKQKEKRVKSVNAPEKFKQKDQIKRDVRTNERGRENPGLKEQQKNIQREKDKPGKNMKKEDKDKGRNGPQGNVQRENNKPQKDMKTNDKGKGKEKKN
jgi:hypothetical protein